MVDRRESIAEQLTALEAMLDGRQGQIWTTMPGILQSYDAEKITCTVQTAIQCQVRDPQGAWTWKTIPILVDCPVGFQRGGGFGFVFPLVEGDEGMVHFCSRCIDAWWQNGGVQPQAELRMHDLSDGMFVPGVCSQPNVPENMPTDSARFWAEDGSLMVDLNKNTETVHIKGTNIFLDGNTVFGGTVSGHSGGGGTINFGSAQLLSNGKHIDSTHEHVDGGGIGNSGPVA